MAGWVGSLWPARRHAVVAGVVAVLLLGLAVPSGALAAEVQVWRVVPRSWAAMQDEFPFYWPTFLALGLILFLERRFPVRSQPSASPGFCLDLVWMLLTAPLTILVVAWYSRVLRWASAHAFGSLSLDLSEHLPFVVVVVVCFVVGDFLAWVHHYVKHRVPMLWRFHAVHHSSVEMNPFADARIHVVELFVNRTVTVVPFLLLGGDVRDGLVAMLLIQLWYARFYHSNIRTDLGPLRHVLVTPQSHRVHHSVDARDADRNYGSILSVWDRLFGTMARDHERYPDTGLADRSFPNPTSRRPTELVRVYALQFAYPFSARRVPAPAQMVRS